MVLITVQAAYAVFCPKCGVKSSSDANFCKKCGLKLPDADTGTKDDDGQDMGKVHPNTSQMFPESADKLLTGEDLQGMSNKQLEIARNEIYARHGWIFKRKDLADYFSYKTWYSPRGAEKDREKINKAIDNELNKTEKKNIALILKYEKAVK